MRNIYLDNNASTPLDPRVFEAMKPFFLEDFGNPHSTTHVFGRRAYQAIETARTQISGLINCFPNEIVFTSGATEANNLAIFGLSNGWGTGRPKLLVLSTEHPSVLEPAIKLQSQGFKLEYIPVDKYGFVILDILENLLIDGPSIVSIGSANGEIGTIQPMAKISEICKKFDAIFHCDASQAIGKIPINFEVLGIDILTMSGHKFYGPKGIGALIIRNDLKKFITPQILGGGQQGSLRSGTLPTSLCVGFGEASSIASLEMDSYNTHIKNLMNDFIIFLNESRIDFNINGSLDSRIPGNLNITVNGIDNLELMSLLSDLAISVGSACSSHAQKILPSHVLKAISLNNSEIKSSFRIGIGRFNTIEEINISVQQLGVAIKKLRNHYF